MSTRYVSIGVDSTHRYAFMLPLTAFCFRSVAGYKPLVFLVGAEAMWADDRHLSLVVRALHDVDSRVVYTGDFPTQRSATVAQVARLMAGCLDLADDDYCLTSDADMWPVSSEFYQPPGLPTRLFHTYADAYAGAPTYKVPLCHVGLHVRDWRDVMGTSFGEDALRVHLNRVFAVLDERLGPCDPKDNSWWQNIDTDARWSFDENYFSERLAKWPALRTAEHRLVHRRGSPPSDRLWALNWNRPIYENKSVDGFVDCHLHFCRDAFNAESWRHVYSLFEILVKDEGTRKWARDYFTQWNAV